MGIFIRFYCLIIVLNPPGKATSQPVEDTTRVMRYLAISSEHYYAERMDSAEYYCRKAGVLARSLGFRKGIAEFVSNYLPILNRQGKYKEALTLALESLEISKAMNNRSMLAMAYNNVGNQNQYLGDLKSSATQYLNALIFSEGVDPPERRMRYSNNLASVFLQLEDKSKSYYYAKKSYQLASSTSDSVGKASVLVNLALSEVLNGKLDDALLHLDEVYALGKALRDESYVLDALINKADVYAARKDYEKALQLYHRSYRVLERYPVPDYQLYVYWGLAQNNFHLGNYNVAAAYLTSAITIAKDIEALQELSKLYLLGADIHERKADPAQALSLRKQYQSLNDSLIGAETQRNIHQLEIEYQTAQKEKAISDQELIIARNRLEIERKDKSILLWSAVAVVLLSFIIVFVMLYRTKQRRNMEKLELLRRRNELEVLNALVEGEEKERSRLARELHDGVGGILSASRMHLSIMEAEAQDARSFQIKNVSSMIDQAAQEIRTIAHNLFPDILMANDLHVALGDFCERIRSAGLDIEYYCLGGIPSLDNHLKLALYRAVQELVNNAMKHARADRVIVQMSMHDDVITILVEDNGIGFEATTAKGMGLINLEKKVRNLNGQLTIESRANEGTSVQLEFHLRSLFEEKAVAHTAQS